MRGGGRIGGGEVLDGGRRPRVLVSSPSLSFLSPAVPPCLRVLPRSRLVFVCVYCLVCGVWRYARRRCSSRFLVSCAAMRTTATATAAAADGHPPFTHTSPPPSMYADSNRALVNAYASGPMTSGGGGGASPLDNHPQLLQTSSSLPSPPYFSHTINAHLLQHSPLSASTASSSSVLSASANSSPAAIGSGSAASPPLLLHSNVYIAGIPHHWGKVHLDDYFSPFGPISESRILLDKVSQAPRGIAFVRFVHVEAARMAIKHCHGTTPPGKTTTHKQNY